MPEGILNTKIMSFFMWRSNTLFTGLVYFLFPLCSILAQVDHVGNDKMDLLINNNYLKIPYFSNFSIDKPRSDIAHAIIVLHGVERNAGDYYNNLITAAASRPLSSDSTIIVSPQFLAEEDIDYHRLDREHLYWTEGGWTSGSNSRNESSNPRPARIPSFAVLDSLMMKLSKTFPNLSTIIFAGHSAGGQVVNRYSATSPIPDILCETYGISSKFIVANPSSYLYLDSQRAISGKIDQFGVPNNDCPEFNNWKFGLDNLFTYPALIGQDSIRRLLSKRHIAYLLGQLDDNPNSSSLDKSCEANLQGRHRLERGTIYFNYLKNYYGTQIKNTQSIDTIPNSGHDHFKMFNSDKGLYHLFEAIPSSCKSLLSSNSVEIKQQKFIVYPNPSNENMTLKYLSDEHLDVKIKITDMVGRIVSPETKTIGELTHQSWELLIDNLTPGIYHLDVYNEQGIIFTKAIVKI